MTFALHIDSTRWQQHIDSTIARLCPLAAIVPVIKGNGYGIGQWRLGAQAARTGADVVAVGTVWEAAEMLTATDATVLVLEPWDSRDRLAHQAWVHLQPSRVIATIANPQSLMDLLDWQTGPVTVILEGRTAMARFGFTQSELLSALAAPTVRAAVSQGRLTIAGLALHMPIVQPADEPAARGASSPASAKVRQALAWIGVWAAESAALNLDPHVWVSHLDTSELAAVAGGAGAAHLHLRIGTELWLDRAALRALGTVLAVHPLQGHKHVGYRQRSGPKDGTVVVVSGGTTHGIGLSAPSPAGNLRQRAVSAGTGVLDAGGRAMSPFTWAGKSRWFAEPPHAQVSMLWLPSGVPVPAIGDDLHAQVRFTTSRFDAIITR